MPRYMREAPTDERHEERGGDRNSASEATPCVPAHGRSRWRRRRRPRRRCARKGRSPWAGCCPGGRSVAGVGRWRPRWRRRRRPRGRVRRRAAQVRSSAATATGRTHSAAGSRGSSRTRRPRRCRPRVASSQASGAVACQPATPRGRRTSARHRARASAGSRRRWRAPSSPRTRRPTRRARAGRPDRPATTAEPAAPRRSAGGWAARDGSRSVSVMGVPVPGSRDPSCSGVADVTHCVEEDLGGGVPVVEGDDVGQRAAAQRP